MHIEQPIILSGRHVRLEPLQPDHAADLFRAAHDEEIWNWMPMAAPTSLAVTRQWIADTLELAATGAIVPFATIDLASGTAIGSTRYMEISPADNGLEIGWTWLAPAHWRSATNSECKYLLLRHAFETIGAFRVQLKTDLRNIRSQTAIARLGAVREGVLREHRIVPKDGYRRSSVYFSILDHEWPEVKSRLEGFLARSVAPAHAPI